MSDDLVQRLREGGCSDYCNEIEAEAADEVERLRAERDALHEGLRVLLRHIEEQGYPRVAEDMAPINMARAALREKP